MEKKQRDLETLIALGFDDKKINTVLYDKHKDFNAVLKILLDKKKIKTTSKKGLKDKRRELLKELKFKPDEICEKMLRVNIKFGEIVSHCLSYRHLNVLPSDSSQTPPKK